MASQETHPREIDNVDARFEESKAKIKEIYNLFYKRGLAKFMFHNELSFTENKWEEKFDSVEVAKEFPEFQELYTEEQDMLAGSVSREEIRQYSNLYKRTKEKIAEIEKKIIEKIDWNSIEAKTARFLFHPYEMSKWNDIKDEEIKKIFDEVKAEEKKYQEEREIQRKYQDIIGPMVRAKRGIEAQVDAVEAVEHAKGGGYASLEDMLSDYVNRMKVFREEIGEQRFQKMVRKSDWKEEEAVREAGLFNEK